MLFTERAPSYRPHVRILQFSSEYSGVSICCTLVRLDLAVFFRIFWRIRFVVHLSDCIAMSGLYGRSSPPNVCRKAWTTKCLQSQLKFLYSTLTSAVQNSLQHVAQLCTHALFPDCQAQVGWKDSEHTSFHTSQSIKTNINTLFHLYQSIETLN